MQIPQYEKYEWQPSFSFTFKSAIKTTIVPQTKLREYIISRIEKQLQKWVFKESEAYQFPSKLYKTVEIMRAGVNWGRRREILKRNNKNGPQCAISLLLLKLHGWSETC
jgi:hypothetical protein